jgi:flagellar motor switch protein FliN/FliY
MGMQNPMAGMQGMGQMGGMSGMGMQNPMAGMQGMGQMGGMQGQMGGGMNMGMGMQNMGGMQGQIMGMNPNVQPVQLPNLQMGSMGAEQGNIGLIMDVFMEMTVELGRTARLSRKFSGWAKVLLSSWTSLR